MKFSANLIFKGTNNASNQLCKSQSGTIGLLSRYWECALVKIFSVFHYTFNSVDTSLNKDSNDELYFKLLIAVGLFSDSVDTTSINQSLIIKT